MKQRDPKAIDAAVERVACAYRGAPPDNAERYAAVEGTEPPLSRQNALHVLGTFMDARSAQFWWERGDIAPADIPSPLRAPAEVVRAALSEWRLAERDDTRALARARAAADYLLKAQAQGGTGVFGFPAWRGREGLGSAVDRLTERAAALGMSSRIESNGWIVDDLGDGGLYYDNGLAGEALIELHRATGDPRYLAGAVAAGDWARARPMVANFNYNGFTVLLLSKLYGATGESHYLDEAVARARMGVLSGQLRSGDERGSWVDPHNKRIVYRFIMIRQLGALLAVMPPKHPQRATIQAGIELALLAVEAQLRRHGGIGNVNAAVVTYCDLRRDFADATWFAHRDRGLEEALTTHTIRAIRDGSVEAGVAAVGCVLETTAIGNPHAAHTGG